MSGLDKETVFEGVLEVDVAGGCVVELIGPELHDVGLITCVGCAIVQADNAPDHRGLFMESLGTMARSRKRWKRNSSRK